MPEPIINLRDSDGNVVGIVDSDIDTDNLIIEHETSGETITIDENGLAASTLNGIASDPHDNTQHSTDYAEDGNHSGTHENGGSDEISVAGLSGDLADAQDPKTHSTSHEDGGADEISVEGLSGDLADAQDPKTHDNGSHSEVYITAVGAEEDGSLVVDATDLNFTESGAATVDVSDDGDGTATIDISSTDTDTDTHTDVSDGGTLVVSDVDDINFGSNISVTDDTDGTVTVDASGGGGGVSATTARRYGLIGGI